MKKLLAIVMILGLATVASANTVVNFSIVTTVGGLDSINVTDGATSISLIADQDLWEIRGIDFLSAGDTGNALSSGAWATALGNNTGAGGSDGSASNNDITGAALYGSKAALGAAGSALYTMIVTPTAEGSVNVANVGQVGFYGPNPFTSLPFDLGTLTQLTIVPEPMTLSLLGLGGLALLRRRR